MDPRGGPSAQPKPCSAQIRGIAPSVTTGTPWKGSMGLCVPTGSGACWGPVILLGRADWFWWDPQGSSCLQPRLLSRAEVGQLFALEAGFRQFSPGWMLPRCRQVPMTTLTLARAEGLFPWLPALVPAPPGGCFPGTQEAQPWSETQEGMWSRSFWDKLVQVPGLAARAGRTWVDLEGFGGPPKGSQHFPDRPVQSWRRIRGLGSGCWGSESQAEP